MCCKLKTVSYFYFSVVAVHGAHGHYAQKLLNDLMENYSNALRPVEDTDSALNVTLQITLSQIKDMVSKGMQVHPPHAKPTTGNMCSRKNSFELPKAEKKEQCH